MKTLSLMVVLFLAFPSMCYATPPTISNVSATLNANGSVTVQATVTAGSGVESVRCSYQGPGDWLRENFSMGYQGSNVYRGTSKIYNQSGTFYYAVEAWSTDFLDNYKRYPTSGDLSVYISRDVTVSVTLKNKYTGALISGVPVHLYEDVLIGGWDGGTKSTGADGKATWTNAPRNKNLKSESGGSPTDGFVTYVSSSFNSGSGVSQTVNLTPESITVTIVVDKGFYVPLSGASVQLEAMPSGWYGGTKTTGSDGKVTWTNAPAQTDVKATASKSGYCTGSA